MSTLVKVGDQAPDFTLMGTGGSEITLSSFQGKSGGVANRTTQKITAEF